MNKWIKCSDRLPEIGETILVYGGGDIHKGRRSLNEEINRSGTILMFSTDGGTLVSHWMPLPKPPEEK